MSSDEVDPRPPARAVVWAVGADPRPAPRLRTARLLGRLGLGLCGAAALAGLVAGVNALALVDPVGTAPSTPLWVAPRPAAAPASPAATPASPSTSPSPAPSPPATGARPRTATASPPSAGDATRGDAGATAVAAERSERTRVADETVRAAAVHRTRADASGTSHASRPRSSGPADRGPSAQRPAKPDAPAARPRVEAAPRSRSVPTGSGSAREQADDRERAEDHDDREQAEDRDDREQAEDRDDREQAEDRDDRSGHGGGSEDDSRDDDGGSRSGSSHPEDDEDDGDTNDEDEDD